MTPIPHGTYGGYQRCRRAQDQACAACRQANREYMARWRQRNPGLQALSASTQMARDRALRRLAARFPSEFEELYSQELSTLPERDPAWGGAA